MSKNLKRIDLIDAWPDELSRYTRGLNRSEAQAYPLNSVYPIVYMVDWPTKIKENNQVRNYSLYAALGVNLDGGTELLGVWPIREGSVPEWLSVLTELRQRGVEDIFIACVNGIQGLGEAVGQVYPKTQIQVSLIHLLRHSLPYVAAEDYRQVEAELKEIYCADSQAQAEEWLYEFHLKWKDQYPIIAKLWKANWERITPIFDLPQDGRRVVSDISTLETIYPLVQATLMEHAPFSNSAQAVQLAWRDLGGVTNEATRRHRLWSRALNQLVLIFDGRIPMHGLTPFSRSVDSTQAPPATTFSLASGQATVMRGPQLLSAVPRLVPTTTPTMPRPIRKSHPFPGAAQDSLVTRLAQLPVLLILFLMGLLALTFYFER